MAYNRFSSEEVKTLNEILNSTSSKKEALKKAQQELPERAYCSLYQKLDNLINTSPDVLKIKRTSSLVPVIRIDELNNESIIALISIKLKNAERNKLISILTTL